MAETITFRPKPGVLAALDALRDEGNRSFHINAALVDYLGLDMSEDGEGGNGGSPEQVTAEPAPVRRARQAVPAPAGEAPPCPHPKKAHKKLPYGTQCTDCGLMLR